MSAGNEAAYGEALYGTRRATLQRLCGILLAPGLLGTRLTMSQARAAADKPIRLVALGDSLTAGYNLPQSAAFPTVLQAALRKRGHVVDIANAGVSGDTASGGLARLDWSVPDGTDGVILELGANDMLRGTDPDITRKAMEAIVASLVKRKIPVMLAGMYAAPNLGAGYTKRFESIYTDLAGRYGLVLYPFFLDGVMGQTGMTLPDGLHPSAQGVVRIVDGILPSVERFLATLKPS